MPPPVVLEIKRGEREREREELNIIDYEISVGLRAQSVGALHAVFPFPFPKLPKYGLV